MEAKQCSRCKKTQPITEFYTSKVTRDGRLGACKTCRKLEVKLRYYAKPEVIAAYERKRAKDPQRKAKALEYQRNRRSKYPQKEKARRLVFLGIQSGSIKRPDSCSHCGIKCVPEAHHHDYSKPLEVTWYCFKCHREVGHGQRVMSV